MNELEYRHTERSASLALSTGATIHALSITRQRDGNISAFVHVVSPEGSLGAGHLNLGDPRRRHEFAQALANANGLSPDDWTTALTVVYVGIEDALSQIREHLVPEDPGVIDISAADEPGPRSETVHKIIPEGKITSVFADGGTGKSFFVI